MNRSESYTSPLVRNDPIILHTW